MQILSMGIKYEGSRHYHNQNIAENKEKERKGKREEQKDKFIK